MSAVEVQESFQEWLDAMHPRMARFADLLMPPDWSGGLSRESLAELENYLLARWSSAEVFRADDDVDFKDGATRYVGETYLKLAGGYWATPTDPTKPFYGTPVIYTDRDNPPPLPPFNLLAASLKRRTGRELVKVYDGLSKEVDKLRQERGPSWSPRALELPASGGAPVEVKPLPATPECLAWVDSLPDRIDRLRAHLGASSAELDLSSDSLASVESHALRDLSLGDVQPDSTTELAQQYAAYVGEVLRLSAGGDWNLYSEGNPEVDPFADRPYLRRIDADGDPRTAVPILAITRVLKRKTPGVLSEALENYREEFGG